MNDYGIYLDKEIISHILLHESVILPSWLKIKNHTPLLKK